jgi:hypothetical protein
MHRPMQAPKARIPSSVSDIEDFPVETVAGSRPSSTLGDRLMIALAATALLGGLLIAASNFVGTEDGVAASSPSQAGQTSLPERTPRPSPTPRALREVTLEPGTPPAPPPPFDGYTTYWVETVRKTPILDASSDDAGLIELLPPGAVITAERFSTERDLTWLVVFRDEQQGWIRVLDEQGEPLVRVAPVVQGSFSGEIVDIAAGPNGFVAHAWAPVQGPSQPAPFTASSTDGEVWTVSSLPVQPGYGGWAAAWGPSGWLAAATVEGDGPPTVWIWESSDGVTWTPVGEMPIPGQSGVQRMVASERGYLLLLSSLTGRGGAEDLTAWFSSDGITWQESALQTLDLQGIDAYGGAQLRLRPTPHGFLGWAWSDGTVATTQVALSRNGRAWESVTISSGPISMLNVAHAGDSVLALGLDADDRVRAWRGTLNDEGFSLEPAPHLELAFEGTVVTALTTDGDRAWAFGYERQRGAARAWVSDGRTWRSIAVPDGGFGGAPRQAAAGPRGVVVGGAQIGALATSPVLWHLRGDGTWVREAEPVAQPLPEVAPDDCPPMPERAFEFVTLEPSVAVACFGDMPMSFVAWSVRCDDCWGEAPPDLQGPAWLLGAGPMLFLLPDEGDMNSGWWRQGALPPALRWSDELVDTWLRITGHFDDPAAAQCGQVPPDGAAWWWAGPAVDVANCRGSFVVTEAVPVPAPRT